MSDEEEPSTETMLHARYHIARGCDVCSEVKVRKSSHNWRQVSMLPKDALTRLGDSGYSVFTESEICFPSYMDCGLSFLDGLLFSGAMKLRTQRHRNL